MKKLRTNYGFTLIEVLVTATIIALLTAIGVVSYASANRSSRDAKRLADVEQIRAALEMFRADCGSYPVSITFGSTLTSSCTGSGSTVTYMQRVPQDPQSPSRTYFYSRSNPQDYTLTVWSEKNNASRRFGPLGER